jgi:DNA-binding response OmpR family regulator/two-component sensor histidine kinase
MADTKILVVEDEEIVASMINSSLKRYGYATFGHASNGIDALDMIKENIPDLVLMDIMLNDRMDGIDTAKIIHRDYDIPVIFLTANTDEGLIKRAKEASPFGYIIKPFNFRELLTSIELAITRHNHVTELKKSRAFLQSIIDGIAHPIMVIGLDFKIIISNISALELLSDSKIPLNNLTCHQMSHKIDIPCIDFDKDHRCPVIEVRKTLAPSIVQHKHIKPDGEIRYHEVVASPMLGIDGTLQSVIVSYHDYTERKKAEDALSDQKDKFLSVLIHDLKGPLIPILGYTKRLLSGKVKTEEKKQDALNIIHEVAEKLYKDIEDISIRLKERNMIESPDFDIINFGELFAQTISNHIPQIEHKGLKIDVDLEGIRNSNIEINANIYQIKSIIENLLSNAIKYAKSEIKAHLNQTEAFLRFVIIDDGRGIPESLHGDIFKEYFQAPGSEKGVGVGLYSVKRVVKRHNGKIIVKTPPEGGVSFEVYLPYRE